MAQLTRQSPRSTLRRMVAPGRTGLMQPVLTPAVAEHFVHLLAPFSLRSADKSSWEAVARSPLGTGKTAHMEKRQLLLAQQTEEDKASRRFLYL